MGREPGEEARAGTGHKISHHRHKRACEYVYLCALISRHVALAPPPQDPAILEIEIK
jgi:hypothetical protein